MSQYKRKPSPAKKIAILTFYWILELLPFFVFWTNPALTNMLNGVEKTAWLLWKKLQAELRWLLATFPVRVTSATVFWTAFFWGKMNLHLSRADPLPPSLYLFSDFSSVSGVHLLGEMKTPSYGVFTSSARSWYYFSSHTIKAYFISLTTLFVLAKKGHQSNS